jgi:hypothetical protein
MNSDVKAIPEYRTPVVAYKSSQTGLIGISPFQVKNISGYRISCKLNAIKYEQYQHLTRYSPRDFREDLAALMQAYKIRLRFETTRNRLIRHFQFRSNKSIESTELYPMLWRTRPVMQEETCFMALRLSPNSGLSLGNLKTGKKRDVGGLFKIERLPMGFWVLSGQGAYLKNVFDDMGEAMSELPEILTTRVSSLY